MKRLTIASAATLLALGALQTPIAQAQSAATTGDATSTTPGVTGQPAPTPGSVPPAGATATAPGSQAPGSQAPGSQASGTPGANPPAGTMQRDANLATTPQTANHGPQKGANSFTEGQAQGRITDAGFTSVAGLKKDSDGIWRGNAMKNGQTVGVWLDYTGNVGQS